MEIGVGDDWMDRVAAACAAIGTHAVPQRTRSARSLLIEFEAQLPDPRSRAERAVLRAMVIEVALRWGYADHWAYHAEFPDADCLDDPAARALVVWQGATADAKRAFRLWSDAFVLEMERIHPRYRAVELRRELDTDFSKPLSLARLARTRHVTTRCLQRDFEELTEMTVQKYVVTQRLNAAVALLKQTDEKVEWIARIVGWSSRKNFNRALTQHGAPAPSALRLR